MLVVVVCCRVFKDVDMGNRDVLLGNEDLNGNVLKKPNTTNQHYTMNNQIYVRNLWGGDCARVQRVCRTTR